LSEIQQCYAVLLVGHRRTRSIHDEIIGHLFSDVYALTYWLLWTRLWMTL